VSMDRPSKKAARAGAGDLLAAFTAACRDGGLSVTHQRLAIFEAVASNDSHPGAEEIYQSVRSRFPTISRGTVYRTLETLCERGLVQDVSRLQGMARFEAGRPPHHHLVCLSCRRIIDVYDESLNRLPVSWRRRTPAGGAGEVAQFAVTGYQIQFVGYCRQCRGGRPLSERPLEARSGNASRNTIGTRRTTTRGQTRGTATKGRRS
jgi:Fur family transcriptional regulator, peroxide stress response regulator